MGSFIPKRPPLVLACFAHDRGDARVQKRVAALQTLRWEVRGYMFYRVRDKVEPPPFWENVELGITENRRYLKRAGVFLASLRRLWQHREALRLTSIFYAVNTDNALLALAARWMAGRPGLPAPLVLELADVQPAMLGRGLSGWVMRALERQVLRRTALLVTTSPGFVRNYFTPLQGFTGPVFLLENKVYPSVEVAELVEPQARHGPARGGRPWVIGLFGALRCRRSIELMRQLADRFPDRVHFYLRGYPSGVDAPGIATLLEGLPHLERGEAYQYPGGLPDIYRQIDFNWTFDFSDDGANSAWSLSNWIYEGGLFGCPALADAATETGRWVGEHGAGWTFREPLEAALTDFIENLTEAAWQEKSAACARLPHALICGEDDYAALSATLTRMAIGSHFSSYP